MVGGSRPRCPSAGWGWWRCGGCSFGGVFVGGAGCGVAEGDRGRAWVGGVDGGRGRFGASGVAGGRGAVFAVLTALWFRGRPLRTSRDPDERKRLRRRNGLMLVIALAMLAVGATGAVLLLEGPLLPPPIELSQLWTPYTGGSLLVAAALVMFLLSRRLEAWSENRRHSSTDIADLARAHLRPIHYLQTLTSGFSAELSGSVPVRLGRSRSRQWAEHPPTLPQVVKDYREFATLWGFRRSPVLIGLFLRFAVCPLTQQVSVAASECVFERPCRGVDECASSELVEDALCWQQNPVTVGGAC